MQKINLGIIGAGGMGQAFIGLFRKIPDVEVVAVADPVAEKLRLVKDTLHVPQAFADYRDLLKIPGLTAVYIATPNVFHKEQALAALASGLDVLCEKPVALSGADAHDILQQAARSKRIFMADMACRFMKSTQALKRLIERGELGEIYYAKAGYLRRQGTPGLGGWFTNKAMSGGGPLIDLGVHILDKAYWLMGAPRPVAVMGLTFNHLINRTNDSNWPPRESRTGEAFNKPVDVEDLATALIRFENGAALALEASWDGHSVTGMSCDLFGTKAGVRDNGAGVKLFGTNDGMLTETVLDLNSAAGVPSPAEHFIACVRERRAPLTAPSEILAVSRILEAIYQSAATGSEVRL